MSRTFDFFDIRSPSYLFKETVLTHILPFLDPVIFGSFEKTAADNHRLGRRLPLLSVIIALPSPFSAGVSRSCLLFRPVHLNAARAMSHNLCRNAAKEKSPDSAYTPVSDHDHRRVTLCRQVKNFLAGNACLDLHRAGRHGRIHFFPYIFNDLPKLIVDIVFRWLQVERVSLVLHVLVLSRFNGMEKHQICIFLCILQGIFDYMFACFASIDGKNYTFHQNRLPQKKRVHNFLFAGFDISRPCLYLHVIKLPSGSNTPVLVTAPFLYRPPSSASPGFPSVSARPSPPLQPL
jgi:hypothetical protein